MMIFDRDVTFDKSTILKNQYEVPQYDSNYKSTLQ